MRDFLLAFAYEVVTWVCIAGCVGGIFYCLGKRNRTGVILSGIGLALSVITMFGLLAYRYARANDVKQALSVLPRTRVTDQLSKDEDLEATYVVLEKEFGLAPGTLARELPGLARRWYN